MKLSEIKQWILEKYNEVSQARDDLEQLVNEAYEAGRKAEREEFDHEMYNFPILEGRTLMMCVRYDDKIFTESIEWEAGKDPEIAVRQMEERITDKIFEEYLRNT